MKNYQKYKNRLCGDNMQKKENSTSNFRKIIKYVLLISIIIISGLLSYYYLKLGLNNKYNKEVEYNSTSNTTYKVYLFENDYFEEPYLEMGKTYISSLINYIDIDFNYNLNFSEFLSGQYTYYIKGTIAADKLKEDSSYWSKSYILKQPETITYNNQNNFTVLTNVKIDYQKYNRLLNEFRKEYGISFNGFFRVEFIIESTNEANNIKEKIPIKSITEVKIPLTQQVIDLSIDLKNNNDQGEVTETITNNDINHYVFLTLSVILALFTLLLIIKAVKLLLKYYSNKSEYSKKLKKILSTYDNIIVNVSSIPKLEDLKQIEVSNFSEMIDAQSEVRMPINYLEEEKNYKSIFILVSDNIAWKYTLINQEKNIKKRKSKR